MNNGRTFFIAPIFLAITLACVVPGLPISSTPLPTLTADTGAIETMVAGTVSAAIAQTQQSMPSPAPASVIIVTAPPTSTPLPTPTAEPTATFTPEATSPSKSVLNKQEDNSILFRDELAHYEIKLPAGWLAVRVNEKEYVDAFSLELSANTHIQQSLLGIQNENPNVFRLLAIDTQPSHIQNEFVTDMRFVLDQEMDISLNTDADLQSIASKIPDSATVFRFEVTSVKIVKSASGMDFGIIEAKSSFTNALGVDVPLYQKQVFFTVPAGTQSITLTTVSDLKETILPAFDTMLNTIKIVDEQ